MDPITDDNNRKRFRASAERIATIRHTWNSAAMDAFNKLEAADPEVAKAALVFFWTHAAAAHYFAREQPTYEVENYYAVLAAGGRERILYVLRGLYFGHYI